MPEKRESMNADGTPYTGNQMFKGQGIVRYCLLCDAHRPQLGGKLRAIAGGKHWVCNLHLEKKKPWKYCKKCGKEIKSPTGYCYECYKGETLTASPYGLINANKEFKYAPSERR